jgi:predicted ATP-grasp superfamily ATP-dependent carboligase
MTGPGCTPVVVLRSVEHGPLGILRSLGRLGIPVYVVESYTWNPASFSRYCAGTFRHQVENARAEDLLEALRQVGRTLGRAVLVPTADDAAIFVAEHAAALKLWFDFPEAAPELTRTLANKEQVHLLAQNCAVDTPETSFPRTRSEVVEYARSRPFPVLMKGIDVMRLFRRAGRRMFLVCNGEELIRVYDALPESEKLNILLQEYIPGGDHTVWMFNGYFDELSRCIFGATAKKIRQCPVYNGVTSLGIALENAEIRQITERFMKAIAYRGPVDIDFKYDPRDGRYKVLDVNPRIGASFRLFLAENGLDVARAAYLHLTGQPVTSSAPVVGRKWIVEDLDTVSCFKYFRDRRLGFGDWQRSYRNIEESAYFAPDDPLPLMAMFAIDAGKAFRRLARKISGKIAGRFAGKKPSTVILGEKTAVFPSGAGPR